MWQIFFFFHFLSSKFEHFPPPSSGKFNSIKLKNRSLSNKEALWVGADESQREWQVSDVPDSTGTSC